MKKSFLAMGILAICITSISQEIQHDAVAINIEVPVRVFKGDTFIDSLTLDDFEVYEDGVLQEIEAVYLIFKNDIEREEINISQEQKKIRSSPDVESRTFVIVFEIIDYIHQFGDVIDIFFDEVFSVGDTLIVVTPLRTLNLHRDSLGNRTKSQVADELKEKLKNDARVGNWEYRSITRYGNMDMESAQRLKYLRYLEESKLLGFAEYLKSVEGQKHVFFLYQQDETPLIGKEITYDPKKVKQIFSDASISAHFLFLPQTRITSIDVLEKRRSFGSRPPEDTSYINIYTAFSEVAHATGGIIASSINPTHMFKKAFDASQNYYLLYYTPKDYKSDGKFRNIKVKVKGKKYRVLHRAGYLAD